MPDGSSSAAPVIQPGPSCSFWATERTREKKAATCGRRLFPVCPIRVPSPDLHRYNHFAGRLAVGVQADRFAGAGEGKAGGDVGLDLAFSHPLRDVGEVLQVALRVARGKGAPEYAQHIAAFEQREVQRDFRDFTRRETDHEEAAFP